MPSLAGMFLVARANLRDAFFGQTVVLMLDHDEDGSLGVVLNRPAQTKNAPFPVFHGGPCQVDGFLMIHGQDDWTDADHAPPKSICPGVYLGDESSFERVNDNPEIAWRYRVFAGYSGWGPLQLEKEMSENAWLVLPANGDLVFDTPIGELWKKLTPSLPTPSLN